MIVDKIDHTQAFYKQASEFLLKEEAKYNLLIGLCLSQESLGRRVDAYILREGEKIIGAALSGKKFVITDLPLEACKLLSAALMKDRIAIPGVVGPDSSAVRFGSEYSNLTKRPWKMEMEQWIYRNDRILFPDNMIGEMVLMEDVALAKKWFHEFALEAVPHEANYEKDSRQAELFVRTGTLYALKVEDVVVSIAGLSGKSPNGIRLSAVYTPLEHRKKGYASELVAKLTQQQIDNGRAFCVLYTDANNAASNAIYQRLGYQIVCASNMLSFGN